MRLKKLGFQLAWTTAMAVFSGAYFGQTAFADFGSAYDRLYPYYVEFCAVTQLKPLNGINGGGVGGHGVLYLKGACRDKSASYPRLKLCDEGSIEIFNPEAGASISVDQIFQNTNWVALDGKDLLITGGFPTNERLDSIAQEKLIHEVASLNLFKGIKVYPEYLKNKPSQMSEEEYLARLTLSTDFALNFGRNVYCTRLPIKREMLSPMIEYLNSMNELYQQNDDYKWSGVFNNCTHTTRNAIAAAGVYRPYAIEQNILKQVFNLAIPSNEFIELEKLGNDESLEDVVSFYKDPYKRKALLEQNWMATQPGVLTDNHRMIQDNALYDTKSDFLILDPYPFRPSLDEFNRINSEPRYSDIRANLRYFKAKYQNVLDSRLSLEDLREINEARSQGDTAIIAPNLNTQEFERFYNAYYRKIESALQNVNEKLSLIVN